MIKNKNLDPDARQRQVCQHVDLSADVGKQFVTYYDKNRQAQVKAIDVVYSLPTGGTACYDVKVGYPGALTKWLTFIPSTSTATNTVQNKTVTSSTVRLAANTPMLLTVGSTANDNIGEIDVCITYEVLDRPVV